MFRGSRVLLHFFPPRCSTNTSNLREMDEASEKLLTSLSDSEDELYDVPRRCNSTASSFQTYFALILLVCLLSSNLGWYLRSTPNNSCVMEKDYFGSRSKILQPFDYEWNNLTEYETDGSRYADDKWRDIFPAGGGYIKITQSFAKQYSIPSSMTASNSSDMVYILAGFHQLHCMDVVRDTIYQLNGTMMISNPIQWDHILHCVDALRQALKCFLDPTLITLEPGWPGVPNGQLHVCRNYEALKTWAAQHATSLPDA
ncbi:hypothetical protein F5884DRAFT_140582 [Xylogone sp. PMI_703]|nr:hypothetical protein F5884DRAFT_140582 [Xylogone sp. PMI_703]